MSREQRKAIELNKRAKVNEEKGNSILANWMYESAKHYERLAKKTEDALNNMCLGIYTESKGNEFKNQWFAYEEEYAYNFSIQ